MIESHFHIPTQPNTRLNVTLISFLDFQVGILQVFPINILHAFLISYCKCKYMETQWSAKHFDPRGILSG